MKFSKASFSQHTVLLAPAGSKIPAGLQRGEQDGIKHSELLSEVQRLRGRIMVEERATTRDRLDATGRDCSETDNKAWHMATLDSRGQVTACLRFLVHPFDVPIARLTSQRAACAGNAEWARRVRRALEDELALARTHSFSLIELGGWVLSPELRGTAEAVKMVLIVFAWSQLAGGCVGLTTATVLHGSSSILKRLGGEPLRAHGIPLPHYYDPGYQCEMELLKFDSGSPNPRYAAMLRNVRDGLAATTVLLRAS